MKFITSNKKKSFVILLISLLTALIFWSDQNVSGQNLRTNYGTDGIDFLFEANLQSEGDVKPFVISNDPFNSDFSMSRDLIAQGEGTFSGPLLKGTLRWSKLARKYVNSDYSSALLAGWLETDKGAEIMFEALGFAKLVNPKHKTEWQYSFAIRFEESDKPYEWLNNRVGVMIGTFNITSGAAQYQVFLKHYN